MMAWHTFAERGPVVSRTLGMGRKDSRVSWVPTMRRSLSMPAREVTREGPGAEHTGAAVRAPRISSPRDSRSGNHLWSHPDQKRPWEHSGSTETPTGLRRAETTLQRLGKMNYSHSRVDRAKQLERMDLRPDTPDPPLGGHINRILRKWRERGNLHKLWISSTLWTDWALKLT